MSSDWQDRTGPFVWNPIVSTGAGVNLIIPPNPNRRILAFMTGTLTLFIRPERQSVAATVGYTLAINSEKVYSWTEHGQYLTNAWFVSPSGVGDWAWGEASLIAQDAGVHSKGPVEWYRQRLEERRKRKQRINQAVEEMPACAAMLLQTPVQFIQQQAGVSAVGGGGGETGGDSLGTSAPNMIGD